LLNVRLWTAFILLTMLGSASILSLTFPALIDGVVIRSSGQISLSKTTVPAQSGSATDIQAAIDIAAAGGGDVYIPEGTFNFVGIDEPWMTVNVPAGVNLFGAPTQRDANDQVTQWKTILRMPYDVPGSWSDMPVWFTVNGNSDPNKPTRISDIKLVGYRSVDPSSTTLHRGIDINNVVDFRIDHVMLEHTTGGGITIWGSNGVIDHSKLINIYGFDDLSNYLNGNIGYGVAVARGWGAVSFDPTMSVLGKYTSYTIFIEASYFSKWRHVVSSAFGGHYVFRYNIIDQDFGHFSLDAHGMRDTNNRGTRAAEIYENTLINAVLNDFDTIFQDGGGSGVWFNNYIDTSYRSDGIALYPEDAVPDATWQLKDFYLWSKKGPWTPRWDGIPDGFTATRNVLADWNRLAYDRTNPSYPNVNSTWSIAGYIPYIYPHPLTLETSP